MPAPSVTAIDRMIDIFEAFRVRRGPMSLTELAQAANIPVMLHAGMNTAYGQHFTLAVPNATMGEYFLGSAPGVPLQELRLTPSTAVPQGGSVKPSDAPGFGLGLTLDAVHELAV